jgi:hypothetical protein
MSVDDISSADMTGPDETAKPAVYRHLVVQSVGDDELDAIGLAMAALAWAPDDAARKRILAYLYERFRP